MALRQTDVEPPRPAAGLEGRDAGWRWPLAVGACLILLTVPPILLAAMRTPAAQVFSGYVVIARDAYVYEAIWRQGWQGAWLFHSPYTAEALPGVLLYPWYLWPAHLIGWAAGPWLYHLFRLAAAAALLAAVWRLSGELFRPRLLRRWAFLLASLGGGVGVFLPQLRIGPVLTQATEMRSPGSSIADLIAMAPHLPWAMAMMCWVLLVALRLRRRTRLSELISGSAALLGLQLIYPQLSLLAVLVIAAWALTRRLRWPLGFAMMGAALQLPYGLYLAWVWRTSPQALAVIRPSLDVGDLFGFLVLSHLTATGLLALAIARRRLRGDLWLPAFWIIGMTVFMFVPGISSVMCRTFMASSVPFGLCAAAGLLSLVRMLRTRRWRRRVLTLTVAASCLYGVFSLAQPFWIAAYRLDARGEYASRSETTLLQRLAPQVAPGDVVLTSYLDGLDVPAQTSARAYVGHPDMTIDAARKSAEANLYFGSWNAQQRDRFVDVNGIDFVLATDPVAVARLLSDPGLRLLDRSGGAALFAVAR